MQFSTRLFWCLIKFLLYTVIIWNVSHTIHSIKTISTLELAKAIARHRRPKFIIKNSLCYCNRPNIVTITSYCYLEPLYHWKPKLAFNEPYLRYLSTRYLGCPSTKLVKQSLWQWLTRRPLYCQFPSQADCQQRNNFRIHYAP